MDNINESLNKLQELTPEELSALKDSILAEFDSLDSQENRTREVVDTMGALADAHDNVVAEESRREVEAEELSQLAQDAASRIKGGSEDTEEVADEAVDEEVDEASEATAKPVSDDEIEEVDETEEDEEEEDPKKVKEFSESPVDSEEITEARLSVKETVAEDTPVEAELSTEETVEAELSAETPAEAELSAEASDENVDTLSVQDITKESEEETVTASVNPDFEAPAENAPAVEAEVQKVATITAAADIKGFSSGDTMSGLRDVAQAFLDRRKSMKHTTGGDGEQALVASISTADFYNEDRVLDSEDFAGNRAKVEAVVASLRNKTSEETALVAAGGLLGPVDTTWEIYKLGETTGRPVKDALPSFNADRGGLRFMTPPVLKDLEGAVSIWTLQDDIDAAAPGSVKTKPCIRVEAGEEVTVYLEAMPLCLTFGNLGSRAYPELVERHIELAMVWQARFAETRLLTRIGALSTAVTAAKQLGAARDIFVQIEQAAAGLRSRHRLDEYAPFKAMFPVWFKNALRADLVKQLPGDGQEAAFNLAEATINKWFASRNINVTWFVDGEEGQILGEQNAGGLNAFPENVIWYLFPEGTFLYLDGATIDLGIVRDSTLNATNDYKMFLETFENVAKVGVESLRITSQLAIAGASAGTVDTIV